ncbi:hypothetical protein NFI96_031243 [Prochilodus magdalenae]|nr:hypothetical protein NFI96_031243 [Prochilodus magdalenae]
MAVETHFRSLVIVVPRNLKWDGNISSIIKKAQQRMYFLRQLRKFNLSQELMAQFYTYTIESVITSSSTVWHRMAAQPPNMMSTDCSASSASPLRLELEPLRIKPTRLQRSFFPHVITLMNS